MSSSRDDESHQARAARESDAWDAGSVEAISYRWHARAFHVLAGPNTLRAEGAFRSLMTSHARGGRTMDVGCGTGALAAELHALGARRVYAFDVSRREVEDARTHYGSLEGVSFHVHGVDDPITGSFDLIVGRSILHHVNFRSALRSLFDRNLAPGGRMLFMEPMSHPLGLLFHLLVRSAHTADERPLTPNNVHWLKMEFDAHVRPVNFVSFPAGAISSLILRSPDNALMRAADRIDQSLERRPRLAAWGRQGIIVVDRKAVGSKT
jgi:2-polyprenyl-3-methyl-5-hydroxy-6-metoxy-1,4-benzoquinol methylase